MPLEALIAEDEELLRQSLVEQLGRLWPELKLVAECEDGASALEQLAEKQPDIAFLDIRMPGISGIEVARSLAASISTVRQPSARRASIMDWVSR